MKSIKYHFNAVIVVFEQLFKGRFLLFFIPGAIITLIYYWIQSRTTALEDSFMLASDYNWLDWIAGGINKATKAAFSIMGFISEQIYIFVILTVLSPFNTALSEKLDAQLTGFKPEFNLIRFINDFIRMVLIVIIAIVLEITFLFGYWMISALFGLDVIDPLMYFLIAAFFFGFSFYDFSLERYEENVGSSLYYSFSKILTMLISGSLFLLIYEIPYIGIPLAPVLIVMISTVVYLYDTERLKNNQKTEVQK